MARGRKAGPTRLDLRRQAEAAESKDKEKDKEEDEVEEEEEEADDEGGDDDDEKPKAKAKAKPKKKAPAKPKAPSKRTRTPKEVRMRAVWVVFDNAGKRVDTFPFPQKSEAEELLAKKLEEKKTFYLQMVKEHMEV
jgi:hypothetical protein